MKLIHGRVRLAAASITCGLVAALTFMTVPTADGAASPSPTSADDAGFKVISTPGSGQQATLSPELLADLRHHAKTTGADLGDLIDRHEGLEHFEQAIQQVVERPDWFVASGAAASKDSGYDFYLALTEPPSAELLQRLERLPFVVEVRYGLPLSAEQADTFSMAVIRALSRSGVVDLSSLSAGLTDDQSEVSIRFAAAPGASESEIRSAQASAEAVAKRETPNAEDVVVGFDKVSQATSSGRQLLATVKGGKQLTSSGVGVCTSGFTANRGGQLGVITAAHCPNGLQYTGVANTLAFVTAANAADGGAIDLQFHRTLSPHSTVARFKYIDNPTNDERSVTAFSNPPDNTLVCLQGIASDYSCADVQDPQRCGTAEGTFYCGLFELNDDIGAGGDSGGPMFLGTTARGFVQSGGPGFLLWGTQVSRAANNLGANLLTQ